MNIKLIMMMESVRSFFKREEGASAIEYALIAGIMAVFVIAGVNILGGGLDGVFGGIKDALESITPGTAGTPSGG